eukprot:3502767-Pleurochrysis_carterae.AAC.2
MAARVVAREARNVHARFLPRNAVKSAAKSALAPGALARAHASTRACARQKEAEHARARGGKAAEHGRSRGSRRPPRACAHREHGHDARKEFEASKDAVGGVRVVAGAASAAHRARWKREVALPERG